MIFVCTGTQIYQFNRLLQELDKLVETGQIQDEVFAQTGASDYKPKYYKYQQFISSDEFEAYQNKANLIVSHGGTGALIVSSKKGKNIVAVPRLKSFGEHTDDHQLQVVGILEREGYVRAVYDIKELGFVINEALANPINKTYDRESYVMAIIEDYIEGRYITSLK